MIVQHSLKIVLLIVIMAAAGCKKQQSTEPQINYSDYGFEQASTVSLNVCVYFDYGVFEACKTNTIHMLNEMHCYYTPISRDSIYNGALDHYRVLIMPGGDMWQYNSYLTPAGMNAIKKFVSQGGGYIGICGGSYFAANLIVWRGWSGQPRDSVSISGLNLFASIADGPIESFAPSYVDNQCQIQINNKSHPITYNLPDVIQPYYDHGPMFVYNDSVNITMLGKTSHGNKNILLAFQYNSGRVFLTGAHPEASVSRIPWIMVKNAVQWCVKQPY
jgi:glutamine amidotransferase-like uncharacterized protein